jgi:hypothetical protein
MSQRIGMADGRCLTSYESNRILNDIIMSQKSIVPEDNYSFRRFLQQSSPESLQLPLKNAACGGSIDR